MSRTAPGAAGFTLAELSVSVALAGLLCVLLAGLLQQQSELLRWQLGLARQREAQRVPAVVLPLELRWLHPAADLAAASRESLRVRALRGMGTVCMQDGIRVTVRYRGVRAPDPAKDSVLWLRPDTAAPALALQRSAPATSACPATNDELLEWETGQSLPVGSLLLVFETGSYSFSSSALRYRRGAGGRQPLTEELFARESGFELLDAESRVASDPERLAAVRIHLVPGGAAPFPALAAATRAPGVLRLALLNAARTEPGLPLPP